MRLAAVIVGTLTLAACAGVSKRACLSTDWTAAGEEAGAEGRTGADPYLSACRAKGVAPDLAAWRRGVERGLEDFCRPAKAFEAGRTGRAYGGQCADLDEPGIVAAFAKGRAMRDLEKVAAGAAESLAVARADLWAVQERIAQAQEALASPSTTTAERMEYALELRTLSNEARRLEAVVESLFAEERRARRALAEYLGASEAERPVRPLRTSY